MYVIRLQLLCDTVTIIVLYIRQNSIFFTLVFLSNTPRKKKKYPNPYNFCTIKRIPFEYFWVCSFILTYSYSNTFFLSVSSIDLVRYMFAKVFILDFPHWDCLVIVYFQLIEINFTIRRTVFFQQNKHSLLFDFVWCVRKKMHPNKMTRVRWENWLWALFSCAWYIRECIYVFNIKEIWMMIFRVLN